MLEGLSCPLKAGMVEFLKREGPVFRSATVMGRKPNYESRQHEQTLIDPTHFHCPEYCSYALLIDS